MTCRNSKDSIVEYPLTGCVQPRNDKAGECWQHLPRPVSLLNPSYKAMKMSDSNTILIPEVLKSNPEDGSQAPVFNAFEYTTVRPGTAAKLLGITYSTLHGWHSRGQGPRTVPVGKRHVRYRLVDLREWLELNARTPTRKPPKSVK